MDVFISEALLAGMAAGALESLVTSPFEIMKLRAQVAAASRTLKSTPTTERNVISPLFARLLRGYSPDIRAMSNTVNQFRRQYSASPILTTIFMKRASGFCTAAAIHPEISPHKSRKFKKSSAEYIVGRKLNQCSKRGDLGEAIRIYNEARANGIPIDLHMYNVLLYLCTARSNGGDGDGEGSNLDVGLRKGFQIFERMNADGVAPNEATFTSAARLAAAKKDPEMAFELVKKMKECGITPKLRSYGPALFGFCERMMTDEAFGVDAHMVENGVVAEEDEMRALLKLGSEAKLGEKVYEMMHKMRMNVRQVSEHTASVVEEWFSSECAAAVGREIWDVEKVAEAVVKGGGGWHGQGWLGKGKWRVARTEIREDGVCGCCGEKLVSIDIEPKETESFATSVAKLACQKEVKLDFVKFLDWLEKNGPFDAVVDGANIGLWNQHKKFNFPQLRHVVDQLRKMSKSNRLPLVILHRNRVFDGPALYPKNKSLLDGWSKAGALYATPSGSNDDWYWLYAAISSKCLLVTNDEMRDHIFQLLGTSFFPRWKEKHQVRWDAGPAGSYLRMPPKYSIVIQESEEGSWHVPTVSGDDLATPRKWICATRASKGLHSHPVS